MDIQAGETLLGIVQGEDNERVKAVIGTDGFLKYLDIGNLDKTSQFMTEMEAQYQQNKTRLEELINAKGFFPDTSERFIIKSFTYDKDKDDLIFTLEMEDKSSLKIPVTDFEKRMAMGDTQKVAV